MPSSGPRPCALATSASAGDLRLQLATLTSTLVTLVKTVFFGTPEIAVPALEALAATTTVVAVISQPDRPAGRKMKPQPCAVKLAAQRLGLAVHQPVAVKTGLSEWLGERDADLGVVLAYGRILPATVLAAPKHGCVNLHASLLPSYRGAAPIARALQHGETETGVSLMQMDEGLDTGPVYLRRRIVIEEHWNHGDLSAAVAALCAEMVRNDLGSVLTTRPEPQDASRATLAPPIRAEEARIDWSRPALDLHRDVRAFSPTPGAFTFSKGKRVRILKSRVVDSGQDTTTTSPGEVVRCHKSDLFVATGAGLLAVERAQVEGKKPLTASDLVNGRAFELGERLG